VLVAASERIKAELGWEPSRTLEEMIGDAWAFAQAHPNGYSE
jgi:UDP-glucose 4-epimerase